MKILGIAPDVWISSAALIEDGRITAGVAEERLNRQKMSSAFPEQAIAYCLKEAGCTLDSIDQIAVAWNPGVHLRSASRRFTHNMRWRGEYMSSVPSVLLGIQDNPEVTGIDQIIHLADSDTRITFVDHHMSHAANAFLLSPFDDAAILTADGRGEEETCTFGVGHGNQIEKLHSVSLPHSIGLLYGVITEFLGFRPHSDEWKVMALASYGNEKGNKYRSLIRSLIELRDDGAFELDLSYFTYYLFDNKPTMYSSKLIDLLGSPRRRDDPIEQRHYDLALAIQLVFEETFNHMLGRLHDETGQANLAFSGGCVMNSVYNGKVLNTTPFENVFISSCPDDSGVSIGAALYVYNCLNGQTERYPQEHNFYGPEYSSNEIEETLKSFKIPYEYHENIGKVGADLLSKGTLLGWFQGKMEFGQRALGSRSILADPRDIRSKELVNSAVKYREAFRPFAPAILAEQAEFWFEMPPGDSVPYMEKVYPVRPEKRDLIPAVVHVDGTGRLQTVSKDTNPRFHSIIEAFGAITGVPVILNTSFNLNGEPIVSSPVDAIRTFYSCGMDALFLDHYLIRK